MAIVYAEGDNPNADALAKEIAEILTWAYPNHSWWIGVRQGLVSIKNFAVSGARGTIGMARHVSALAPDAAHRKKDVIRAAGELLERAGLRRGAYTGEHVKRMELEKGLEKHWQPSLLPVDVIH